MRNYQNMVYSTALRFVANEAEAEDIAQEVFLRAYEHFDEIQSSPTAGGWLKTVATNRSINYLNRYKKRWRFFSEMRAEESEEVFDVPIPADQSQKLELADRRNQVIAALRKLPPAQRIPLVLYHYEDLSYEEIAAKLDISLGKVKTDIYRGRQALRRLLDIDARSEGATASNAPTVRVQPGLLL